MYIQHIKQIFLICLFLFGINCCIDAQVIKVYNYRLESISSNANQYGEHIGLQFCEQINALIQYHGIDLTIATLTDGSQTINATYQPPLAGSSSTCRIENSSFGKHIAFPNIHQIQQQAGFTGQSLFLSLNGEGHIVLKSGSITKLIV